MRNTAFALSLFILMTLPASLIIGTAPVDVSVEDGEEIVNIDVCHAGKELPGGWMPVIPSPRPPLANTWQEAENLPVQVQFESMPPATEDPPPKTWAA